MTPGIQEHTLPRPPGLVECASVLDIGAGIRPMQWYRPKQHICIEPYAPYCEVLRAAGFECYQSTAAKALAAVMADAVYMLDVIEHMEKDDARAVIAAAQRAARVQVVIYTPLGFVKQTEDAWGMGGESWQTHRSGWHPEDFPGWVTEPFGDEAFFALWTRL